MNFIVSMGNAINEVMGIFGPAVIVPVIIIIISLAMKVPFKKAVQGGLYMGVGLTMFNAILGILMGSISPYVMSMATDIGISLPYVDVGWQGASVIVYSNTIGYVYLVLGLGLNLILFNLEITDTFQPTDIWNYYQFVFWAVIVQFVTGSFALAIFSAVFLNLVVLLIADIIAPSLQEFNGYDNVTLTSVPSGGAPFAMLVKWVLDKFRVKKSERDLEGLADKFGFWGEPLTIGLIVGLLITVLGSTKTLNLAVTWGGIFATMLTVAGVMVIYPAISGLFVKGLIPLSQSMQERIRSGKSNRTRFNIAMDPAIFFGNSSNLTASFILIPIVFFISLVMPGNKILMLADIPAMAFMTAAFICVFRGDILLTILTGTVWFSFANVLNSSVAASFTEAAIKTGVADTMPAVAEAVSQGMGVASWTVGTNPLLFLVYKAFSAPGVMKIFTIGIAIVIYLVIFFHFRKHRVAWHVAAGASEEFLLEKGYIETEPVIEAN